MSDKEEVNTRPVDRAIKELTGLRNSNNLGDKSYGYERISGKIENGVRVITYSVESPLKYGKMKCGVDSLAGIVHPNHLMHIEQVLRQAESFANVRFEKVSGKEVNQADIHLYTGHGMNEGVGGYAMPHGPGRAIVLSPETDKLKYAFAHELGHALGLSHPDIQVGEELARLQGKDSTASGGSPAYNSAGTTMSYNASVGNPDRAFSTYDIAALQYLYGSPENKSPHELIATDTEVPPAIYSEKPVTITVSDASPREFSNITLPSTSGDRVRIFAYSYPLAFDTQIINVMGADSLTQSVSFTGNDLPNILKGGSGNDYLTTKGDGDRLTGGAGADHFFISSDSKNNVIMDLNTQENDRIVVSGEVTNIELKTIDPALDASEPYNRPLLEKSKGTYLLGYDTAGQLVSSVAIYNQQPEQISGIIKYNTRYSFRTPNVTLSNSTGRSTGSSTTINKKTSVPAEKPPSQPQISLTGLGVDWDGNHSISGDDLRLFTRHVQGLINHARDGEEYAKTQLSRFDVNRDKVFDKDDVAAITAAVIAAGGSAQDKRLLNQISTSLGDEGIEVPPAEPRPPAEPVPKAASGLSFNDLKDMGVDYDHDGKINGPDIRRFANQVTGLMDAAQTGDRTALSLLRKLDVNKNNQFDADDVEGIKSAALEQRVGRNHLEFYLDPIIETLTGKGLQEHTPSIPLPAPAAPVSTRPAVPEPQAPAVPAPPPPPPLSSEAAQLQEFVRGFMSGNTEVVEEKGTARIIMRGRRSKIGSATKPDSERYLAKIVEIRNQAGISENDMPLELERNHGVYTVAIPLTAITAYTKGNETGADPFFKAMNEAQEKISKQLPASPVASSSAPESPAGSEPAPAKSYTVTEVDSPVEQPKGVWDYVKEFFGKVGQFLMNNKGLAIGGGIGGFLGSFLEGVLGKFGKVAGVIAGGFLGARFDGTNGVIGMDHMSGNLKGAVNEYAQLRFTDFKTGEVDQSKVNRFMQKYDSMVAPRMTPQQQEKRAADIKLKTADIKKHIGDAAKEAGGTGTQEAMQSAFDAIKGADRTVLGRINDVTNALDNDLKVPPATTYSPAGIKKAAQHLGAQ